MSRINTPDTRDLTPIFKKITPFHPLRVRTTGAPPRPWLLELPSVESSLSMPAASRRVECGALDFPANHALGDYGKLLLLLPASMGR